MFYFNCSFPDGFLFSSVDSFYVFSSFSFPPVYSFYYLPLSRIYLLFTKSKNGIANYALFRGSKCSDTEAKIQIIFEDIIFFLY